MIGKNVIPQSGLDLIKTALRGITKNCLMAERKHIQIPFMDGKLVLLDLGLLNIPMVVKLGEMILLLLLKQKSIWPGKLKKFVNQP